jgi:hypothetical protein
MFMYAAFCTPASAPPGRYDGFGAKRSVQGAE